MFNRVKIFLESCKNFFKKPVIIVLFIFVFSILLTRLSEGFIFDVLSSSFALFKILLSYLFFLILSYAYLSHKELIEKFNKHQVFIIILGVFLPIFLFSLQLAINDKDLFLKQLASLKEDNNRNSDYLKSVNNDIKNDKYVIFWKSFSTDNYKGYWSYISLNYSQECKNLYADLTQRFDILNNITVLTHLENLA